MATSVVKSTPAGLHCLSKKKKNTFNNLSHVKTNQSKIYPNIKITNIKVKVKKRCIRENLMLHTSTKSELLSLIKKMLKVLNSFGIGKSDQCMV